MKKIKNRFWKIGILLIGISLLLWNCQKDSLFSTDKTPVIENQTSKLIIKPVFKETIEKNSKLKAKLESLNNKLKANKSAKTSNKKVQAGEYDFIIDTDHATYIEDGNYNSYTFPIVQDKNQNIKNILFSLNDDNEYDSYIVNYDYTYKDLETLDATELSNRTEMKRINIDFNLLAAKLKSDWVCVYSYEYVQTGTKFVDIGDSQLIEDVYSWVLIASSCQVVTYDDGSNNNPSGSSTNTTTVGNTTPGGGSSGGMITSPTITPYDEVDLEKFNTLKSKLKLNIKEYNWIIGIDNYEPSIATYDYLDKNNWSIEAENFAIEAIRAFMNGESVDFVNKIILKSTFLNNPRLKCVYTKFKAGTNTISHYLENFLGEKPVSHLNFIADDNFSIKYSDYATAGAITSPPVGGYNNSSTLDYNIDIIFNTDTRLPSSEQNMPTIILATELIHEMVHAEMYRKLLASAHLPNVNWKNYSGTEWHNFVDSLANNYEGLFTYYNRYYWNNPNPTSPQHNMMASHYREMIVSALKDFDKNQHTDAFYNALAWIGLKNTVAWNDSTTDRASINAIISNAIKNETHDCTN